MDIDHLEGSARKLAFAPVAEKRSLRREIERRAEEAGIFLGSIAPVYRGMASGAYRGFTVPAANIRGLTFDLARAAFQAAREVEAGPFMFEIAPSELAAGRQTFDEFAGVILAAALAEGWRGPLFLQGDHFHLESADPIALAGLQELCRQAIEAGFYQIDIDASDLGGRPGAPAGERESANATATAKAIDLVRRLTPLGPKLVLGGEVGRIGGELTTETDFRHFLRQVGEELRPGAPGLGKVSVNSGTQHGGLVDEAGMVGRMTVDFELLRLLSEIARREFGLPGIVQHGASTMSLDQMARLSGCGVNEVHLATAIQARVFGHPAFPAALLDRMERELEADGQGSQGAETPADVRPGAEGPARGSGTEGAGRGTLSQSARRRATLPQAVREHGWLAWGRYKGELWGLPAEVRSQLREATAEWFREVFRALDLAGTRSITEGIASQARIGG